MNTYKNANVVLVIVGLAAWLLLLVFDGWVLLNLWSWFVAPVFDIPLLTLIQAAGLCLIVGFITPSDKSKQGDDFGKDLLDGTLRTLLKGLMVLAAGWIFTLFIH